MDSEAKGGGFESRRAHQIPQFDINVNQTSSVFHKNVTY